MEQGKTRPLAASYLLYHTMCFVVEICVVGEIDPFIHFVYSILALIWFICHIITTPASPRKIMFVCSLCHVFLYFLGKYSK